MLEKNEIQLRYLNLLKKALINEIDLENKLRAQYLLECASKGISPDPGTSRDIFLARRELYNELKEAQRAGGYRLKRDGSWPFTLIGLNRLNNIEACLDQIEEDQIPGDCVEAGVWRGGSTIFMRAYLKAYGIEDRSVWLLDSFKGLPEPNHTAEGNYDFYKYDVLSINESIVRHNFELFDLLDEKVKFLPGWFKDTLPEAPIETIALLRLDADMFESTLDVLTFLYPKLSAGGYVIIDDYGFVPPCFHAVNAYRVRHGIEAPMIRIDDTAIFWRKPRAAGKI